MYDNDHKHKAILLILIKAVNELIVLYMFNPCLVTRRK